MKLQYNVCPDCIFKSIYYREICEHPNHMKVNYITGKKKGVNCVEVRGGSISCIYFKPNMEKTHNGITS